MRLETLADAWVAEGKFDEACEALGQAVNSRRSARLWFAYGRILVLVGRIDDAATWLRRASTRLPWLSQRTRWRTACRLMVDCLDGGTAVEAELADDGRRERDLAAASWLAIAMILASRGRVGTAARIAEVHLSRLAIPGRAFDAVISWTAEGLEASDELLSRLVKSSRLSPDELLKLLRRLFTQRHHAALVRLLKLLTLLPQIASDPVLDALHDSVADFEAVAIYATIPIIGAALAEMKHVQLLRKWATLLSIDPLKAVDPMPEFVRFVPISEYARREWTALTGTCGER